MSTTAGSTSRRRRMIHRNASVDDYPPEADLPRRRRASSPWPRRLFLIALGVAILVWAAPIIIAATPLRNYLLQMALSPEQGRITSTGASLGWFSPVVLRDVEVRDADAEPLLAVETVSTSKSLLGLLTDSSALGTIHIARPYAQVQVRSGSSNVEDFIAPWLNSKGSGAVPSLEIDIKDGNLLYVDSTTGRQWHCENIKASTSLTGGADSLLSIDVTAALTDGMEPGRLQFTGTIPLASTAATSEASQLQLQTQKMQMVMLQGILSRWLPDVQLFGTLTSDLQVSWGAAGQAEVVARGQINVAQLAVHSPYLRGDRLELARVELPCHVSFEQSRIVIHEAQLRCDLGQLSANGSVNLDSFHAEGVLAALAAENYSIEAKIDLARLATALPHTLSVRENTSITGGTANLKLVSSTEAAGHRWQGQLETAGLEAVNAGQRVTWEQPVAIDLSALSNAQGVTVERLTCKSQFMEFAVSGTPAQLAGQGKFDLTEMMAKVDQFVDLGSWRVAGRGQANIAWNQSPNGAFRAGCAIDLENFELSTPDGLPWQDEHLLVEATADGIWANGQLIQLSAAEARVGAAPDQLHAVLMSPIVERPKDAIWPVNVELKGNIPRWLARFRPFYNVEGLQLAGDATLQTRVLASQAGVELHQLNLRVDQFAYTGGGLFIREPALELYGTGRWLQANRQLDLAATTLRGSDLLVETPGITLTLGELAGPRMQGKLHVASSIEKLHQFLLDPNQAQVNQAVGSYMTTGQFDATVDMQHAGTETAANLAVSLRPFKVFERRQNKSGRVVPIERWSEPDLNIAANAVYERKADRMDIKSAAISGQTVAANAAGKIENVMGEMQLDLGGQLEYDLDKLMPLLTNYLGEGIALRGRETGRFTVRGPAWGFPDTRGNVRPWSQRLAGDVTLGWQRSDLYGLDLGPGTATASLEKGIVRFKPIKVALSEGELTSAPVIQLDPQPAVVFMSKGPLLTNVRLSPQFCDAWLKYAAPIAAEATDTEGKFSIDLDGGRIPLAAPATSDIGGRLVLHSVQVKPGPLANNYILLGQQLEAILKRQVPPTELRGTQSPLVGIADQTVIFRMLDGRIHHQNLVANIAGSTLTTQGSVGVDQSLALNAQMPLADRWIGNEPALQGFKGQVVQVNVGGTLSRPAIDKRSVESIASQMVRGAVQNTIQNELSKQLDRLLPPRR